MLPLDVAVSDSKSPNITHFIFKSTATVAVFHIFVAFEAGLLNILYNIPSDR